MSLVRSAWTAEGFGYTPLAPACLSCLLEADRYNDLTALLSLKRHRFWPDERFAIEALLRQGRSEEALASAGYRRYGVGYGSQALQRRSSSL